MILDEAALLEEIDGDRELLEHWLEIFDRDCRDRLPRLRAAVDAGDSETVMNQAHALKGGLGVLFAKTAFDTDSQLELSGRNAELGDAPRQLDLLEADLQQLRQALEQLNVA